MSVINLSGGQLAASQQFQLQPGDISGATNIGELKDVDTTGVANNSILKYNSSTNKFEIAVDATANSLNGLTDVDIGYGSLTLANNHVLSYNSTAGKWVNFQPRIDSVHLSNFTGGFTTGQIMQYNGTNWNAVDATSVLNSDLVNDTSPQLGGNLDMNNFLIDGTNIVKMQRQSNDEQSGVAHLRKNVGAGGDLTHRVPIYFNVNDGTADHTFARIDARREGTSERYITLATFDDDTSNRKDVLEVFRDSSDNYGVTVDGVLTASAGNTPVIANGTGNNNQSSSLLIQKTAGNLTRGVNQAYRITDGSTTYNLHQIRSRRHGSETAKRLTFYDINDAGNGVTAQLAEFRLNSAYTASNQLVEMNMGGRINLTIGNADDMPNSNITTVNMDGTTDTNHNILTGKMDFGSSSIADGAQVQFAADAMNDASGEKRIGTLLFAYGADQKDNKVEIRCANHDLSTQSFFKIDGEQAGTSVPFNVPSYTVATLPTSGINSGSLAMVTNCNTADASTQKALCFYDGGAWKYSHLPATTVRT